MNFQSLLKKTSICEVTVRKNEANFFVGTGQKQIRRRNLHNNNQLSVFAMNGLNGEGGTSERFTSGRGADEVGVRGLH